LGFRFGVEPKAIGVGDNLAALWHKLKEQQIKIKNKK
jgi:hypothetical protein